MVFIMALPLTPPEPLVLNNVKTAVDLDTRLTLFEYRHVLDMRATNEVYKWTAYGIATWFHTADFRASIYDFRQVEYFEIGNTPIAIRASQEVNRLTDLSKYPIVLLVNTLKQEVRVRTTAMGGDGARKYVTRNTSDALNFINEWNHHHKRYFDLSDEIMRLWPFVS